MTPAAERCLPATRQSLVDAEVTVAEARTFVAHVAELLGEGTRS